MAVETVRFDDGEKYIEDFLRLPKFLYSKRELTQNENEERLLLRSGHPLSGYFHITKFLVYKDAAVAARCAVTTYPGDSAAYLGFFECVDDPACSRLLFSAAADYAVESGCDKIIGPVDASFWIKYRLKINKFEDRPYISEPYNKDYYLKLFLDNGYRIMEKYSSNVYKKQSFFGYRHNKSEERYQKYAKDYDIVSPKQKDWDKTIREIYALITDLYKNFPVFKMIGEEDFIKHFENFRYILDLSMVKMAYCGGEPVGFFIGVPDYSNALYGKIRLSTYLKVLLKKIRSPRYIMLYMGVSKKHRGLGLAMIALIIKNVNRKHASAVGALIKEGKVTGGYGADMIDSQYRYVLLEHGLENRPAGTGG